MKGAGVNQPLDPTRDTSLGHIIGPDHIDLEGQDRMWSQHRNIDRGIHALTGGEHLIVIDDIDNPVLMRSTQYLGNRCPRILRWRSGHFLHRLQVGHAQGVVILERSDRRRPDRPAGSE